MMNTAAIQQNWPADLDIGQQFEANCINILGREGFLAERCDSYAHDIQFHAGGRWWTVECKHDGKAVHTRNLYFETACRGKPSGIFASTADYWMHGTGMAPVYLFRRVELVAYLEQAVLDGKAREVFGGGDDGQSSGIILNVDMALRVPHTKEYF